MLAAPAFGARLCAYAAAGEVGFRAGERRAAHAAARRDVTRAARIAFRPVYPPRRHNVDACSRAAAMKVRWADEEHGHRTAEGLTLRQLARMAHPRVRSPTLS
jgi:hypothetical protein